MKAKKTTTRVLCMIMSFLMLTGTIPDMGMTAMAADDNNVITDETTLADELIDRIGLSDIQAEEVADNADGTESTTYKVWVGNTRVTEANRTDILGDGTASFDPATDTLTLNNAVINTYSTTEDDTHTDGYNIYAEQTLVIKGSATLSSGKGGINVFDFSGKATLTIDADLNIDTETTGIMGFGPDIYITGGNINIKTAANSIGIMGYNQNIRITGGNISISGEPMLGIFGVKVLEISNAEIDVCGSQAAVAMNYADANINFTLPTWITEPEGAQVGNVMLPNSKNELIATAGIANADGTNATHIKIGSKPGVVIRIVTFDIQKHKASISPVKIESGYPVSEPVVPEDNGYIVCGWYKDAECTDKYDFSTPVTEDITLYSKWGKNLTIDPIYGSGSPLDPLPAIIPGKTTDLYLVKGQKFNIGEGWTVAKTGSKVVSISKKGVFNAKKAGEAVITAESGENTYSVNVHVAAPKFTARSVKLEIKSADGTAYTTDLNLDSINKEHYNVLWYSASPDVATVDQNGKVTAVSQGKAKVTAYVYGKAYTCTVSVKEQTAAGKRTLHIAKGFSKSLSIKGVKNPVWTDSPKGIVSFIGKKKISGDVAGFTTLTTTAGENTYTVETYVEDLTLSDSGNYLTKDKSANKYELSINTGDTTRILPDSSVDQSIIFKSSKPGVAFIDEEGNVYARSKGSCKLTAKIDGKTITINLEVK